MGEGRLGVRVPGLKSRLVPIRRHYTDLARHALELDVALHHHPGPKSEIKPAGLVLSWMAANWKQRTFQRTNVGVALGHIPQPIAEDYGLFAFGGGVRSARVLG